MQRFSLLIIVSLLSLIARSPAGTITDDFSADVDYLADGISGTVWDGLYPGAGEFNHTGLGSSGPGATLQCDANLSAPNTLTIRTMGTDWEHADDDGFFLYRVVKGDFSAVVRVVHPYDNSQWNTAGLQARAFEPNGDPSGGGEDYVSWTRFDQVGIGNYFRNVVNGSTDRRTKDPGTNYWLRLDRTGNTFAAYERATATGAWVLMDTQVRDDFAGEPLQVGIIHATFHGEQRGVQFTDFSLTAAQFDATVSPPAPPAGLTLATNAGGLEVAWTPGTGSAGSVVVLWPGTNTVLQQRPANGLTYAGDARYGLGDPLPAAGHYVAYAGPGAGVTVSNLVIGIDYNVAVFAYAGSGDSIAYHPVPAIAAHSIPAPGFLARATLEGTNVCITFNTRPPRYYRVQRADSLDPPLWQNLFAIPEQATATAMLCLDGTGVSAHQRFYRVQEFDLPPAGVNLAPVSLPVTSHVSPWETLSAIHDGYDPVNSADNSHGAYGNWPETGTQWVEYEWTQPVTTGKIEVYWWNDGAGIAAPSACRLLYWDGADYVPVENPSGLGVALDQYNVTTFLEVTTTRLRLEFDSGTASTGILEWKVEDAGGSPNFPPRVAAGVDRAVLVGAETQLNGTVQDDGKLFATPVSLWSLQSGPGVATFGDPGALNTTAVMSTPGAAMLQLTADDGEYVSTGALNVLVVPPMPSAPALPVYPSTYTVDSSLWSYRLRNTIVNWIPYLCDQLNNTNLAEGSINNFLQASNRLAGRAYSVPDVVPWADAYVLNTLEAMCAALMLDPQGDPAIVDAQRLFRTNLNRWIPAILAAQETDGYLHTYTTLRGGARWSNRTLHEGYVGGYLIDAGLTHYVMNHRTNAVLYDAARRLADCWCANIGPGRRTWWDGHQGIEQALVRLGRFVNEFEGPGQGQAYIDLARFLMDGREGGSEYDQSHLPVVQQYEAVGHAVRAAYLYSGMADVALETGDVDYQGAVVSLWDSIVNRKYYVTGGIGSGESSEGFGDNYSLRNNAYCESCSSCGELFFQYKMCLAYRDGRYADLMENTLYNAILGSLDDQANNFYYQNPLDSSTGRYPWHSCPCCVGNIPRTLLMLPTWMYSRGPETIWVNLFVGSTVRIANIAGTAVELIQTTDYPWSGDVSIVVNPDAAAEFTVKIRVPDRAWSTLYVPTPSVGGLSALRVNGTPVSVVPTNGYAVLQRTWNRGDRVDVELPLAVQRIKAIDAVEADRGRVALQYGPLIYNVESVDQDVVNTVLDPTAPLSAVWDGNLLGGMTLITGTYTNGEALTAIPNYARLNRGGRSLVWIRDQ